MTDKPQTPKGPQPALAKSIVDGAFQGGDGTVVEVRLLWQRNWD
jgi:hypothetical protein